MRKGILYIFMIMLAVLLLSDNGLRRSIGDGLFSAISISPWTMGLHIPVLCGFLLLIVGVAGVVKLYRARYPRIVGFLFLIITVFLLVFPLAHKQVMFLIKHNAAGITSMDYNQRDSRCLVKTVDQVVKAFCSFNIYNYGEEHELQIAPKIPIRNSILTFELKTVAIIPHQVNRVTVEFIDKRGKMADFRGTIEKVGASIEVNGTTRRYE